MKTEDLLNLGNYQKLDFVLIGGNASNTDGIAALRPPTKDERRSGLGVKLTVESAQTRTYRKPAISHQDLAHALAGCKRMPTLAAFYHVRGDFSVYHELHRGLMLELCRLIDRKRWPMQVHKRDGGMGYYQGELAALVLDYDANTPLFLAAPGLFSLCVGVTDDVWGKIVRYWYDDLASCFEGWIATANAHVGRRWFADETEQPAVYRASRVDANLDEFNYAPLIQEWTKRAKEMGFNGIPHALDALKTIRLERERRQAETA